MTRGTGMTRQDSQSATRFTLCNWREKYFYGSSHDPVTLSLFPMYTDNDTRSINVSLGDNNVSLTYNPI